MIKRLKYYIALCLALFQGTLSFADDKREAESIIPIVVKLMEAGQLKEAGQFLGKAEKLDPDNDAIQYYKGMLLVAASSQLQNKNSKEMVDCLAAAAQCFAKACATDSTNLWYKRRLGNLLFMLKQDEAAAVTYNKILERAPYDSETMARLADIYISLGQLDKADSLINKVETIEGENGITQLSKLEILRQKGDFNAFFPAMLHFIAEPTIPAAEKCDILGKFMSSNDARFNSQHMTDYDALVQRCMEVYPGDTTVNNFAAGFYFSMGNYRRAIDICGEKPESQTLAYVRFASHMILKDFNAAILDCDYMAGMVTNDPKLLSEVHCNKADCLQYTSRTNEAYREYERALKINPENIVAMNNYAYLMACNGRNLSKCNTLIKKVIEVEPENPTYLDTYGWVLHKQKKNADAKAVFKKAMLYGGKDNAEVLLHYAEVLDSLGDKSLAEAYRTQAESKQ